MIRSIDLPPHVTASVGRDISNFSCTLFGITVRRGRLNARPIGSGTLIRLHGRAAILTAGHVCKNKVWDLVSGSQFQALGLCIATFTHSLRLELDKVKIIGEWNLAGSANGPDWAIIFLPENLENTIAAHKSLIALDSQDHSANWDSIVDSYWVLGGAPSELASEEIVNGRDEQRWNLDFILGSAGVLRQFDAETGIVDAWILRDDRYSGPKKFNGVSGGGLWYSRLTEVEPGAIEASPATLFGVPFYEQPLDEKNTAVRCQLISRVLDRYRLLKLH